jgi:hypothetical protein
MQSRESGGIKKATEIGKIATGKRKSLQEKKKGQQIF